ncbi:PepSY domain-containing protein [Klebsiella pneumoniae]|nr:PepSY domain-containing protein [Klebsiella pneumoniae]
MTTCTSRAAWLNLLRRLHFYIGLFIGPFIFVAALTGTLYVATPQLENWLYHDALHGLAEGTPQPLSAQIAVAEEATQGNLRLLAVRPAPALGETTRIMFADPGLGESESRAIFVDPIALRVKGDMTVYGTSGILPLRQWIDYAHRSLLLGDSGRLYSELAASWMWVAALGGIALWAMTRPKRRLNNALQNHRRLHVTLGWGLLVGMLLFSATGLTWSQWAGGNVDKMRAAARPADAAGQYPALHGRDADDARSPRRTSYGCVGHGPASAGAAAGPVWTRRWRRPSSGGAERQPAEIRPPVSDDRALDGE